MRVNTANPEQNTTGEHGSYAAHENLLLQKRSPRDEKRFRDIHSAQIGIEKRFAIRKNS
jgi:hypothetical protein